MPADRGTPVAAGPVVKPKPAPVRYIPHGSSGPVGAAPKAAPKPAPVVGYGNRSYRQPKPAPKSKPLSVPLKSLLSTIKAVKRTVPHITAFKLPPLTAADVLKATDVIPKISVNLPDINKSAAQAAEVATNPSVYHIVVPKPSGGGGLLGSIEAPFASVINPVAGAIESAGAGVGHVAGNFGSDLIHLGPDVVKGTGALAGAVGSDIGHSLSDIIHGHPFAHEDRTANMVESSVANDPLVRGITTGDWSGAAQHPLQVLLDLSGTGGLAARSASAVARTGALGSELADAAKLESLNREVAPGISGTNEIKRLSPNMAVKALQKAVSSNLNEPGIASHLPEGVRSFVGKRELKLRNQVARLTAAHRLRSSQEVMDAAKALKQAEKPLSKTERGIVQYQVATGAGRAGLENAAARISERQVGESGLRRLATERSSSEHLSNLEQALKKPLNIPAMQKYHDAYAGLQKAITDEKINLGTITPEEATRRTIMQWALQEQPDKFVHVKTPIRNPQYVEAFASANRAVKEAAQGVHEAEIAHAKRVNAVTDIQRQLQEAQHRATAARVKALPTALNRLKSDAARARAVAKAQQTGARVDELKQLAQAERQAVRARGAAEIKAAKAAHSEARAARSAFLKNPEMEPKIRGTMIRDESTPAIRRGALKGQQLRPASTEEMLAAHEASGAAKPAFIHMTNPDKLRHLNWNDIVRNLKEGPAQTGRKGYTGEALASGDWAPGTRALKRSVTQDIRGLGGERMRQDFVNRFGLRPSKDTYFNEREAEQAAIDYERKTGLAAAPLRVEGKNFVVVPDAALREIEHQIKLDYPGAASRGLLGLNRSVRNTWLAFSPRLPIMHSVEIPTRRLLAKAGPLDQRLAKSVLEKASPETQAMLKVSAPGGLGGQLGKLSEADFGALPREQRFAVQRVASRAAGAYNAFAHAIIGAQRWAVKGGEMAALGSHMRRTLREWGVGVGEASFSVEKYAQRLAEGYADPALAEDAARAVHRTMGQYTAFPASVRALTRYGALFLPWYVNAARLLLWGLPKDHALATSLISDVRHLTAPEWDKQHKGLPYDLQSAIPTGPSSYFNFAQLSPIGVTKQPLAEAGQLFAPQFMGPLLAFFGAEDPYGEAFKGPNTPYGQDAMKPLSLGALGMAANALGSETLGPAQRISSAIGGKGSSLYNTSTLLNPQPKPGTAYHGKGIGAGFAREFNPLQGTHFGKKKKGGSLVSGGTIKSGGLTPGGKLYK